MDNDCITHIVYLAPADALPALRLVDRFVNTLCDERFGVLRAFHKAFPDVHPLWACGMRRFTFTPDLHLLYGALMVGGLPQMKELSLGELTDWDMGRLCFAALGGSLRQLLYLTVSGAGMTDQSLLLLSRLLTVGALPRLKQLAWNESKGEDAGLISLAVCIQKGHLPELEQLTLANNRFSDGGVLALASALDDRNAPEGGLPCLRILNLADNAVADVGLLVLSVVLHRMPRLTHLFLSGNNIGSDGMDAFCIATEKNPLVSLCVLEVERNDICDVGMAILLRAIKGGKCFPARPFVNAMRNPGDDAAIRLSYFEY